MRDRMTIANNWRGSLMDKFQTSEFGPPLKEASLDGRLEDWTKALTSAVVHASQAMGWEASAKGHKSKRLPINRNEYLSLDVMAFPPGDCGWRLPKAVMELENSPDDNLIAYSLWKVLCVSADLRIVFCYRKEPQLAPELISFLRREVVAAMTIEERTSLSGETFVVVGGRADAETFPYGFFRWWVLEKNLGKFQLLQ